MAKKAIKITCTGAANVPIELIEPLQGALKELSPASAAKLKATILADGFASLRSNSSSLPT